MRSMKRMKGLALIGALALATPALARPLQIGPPPQTPISRPQPPSSSSACFELRYAQVDGERSRYAKIQAGDKWITGCLGSSGSCLIPTWTRC